MAAFDPPWLEQMTSTSMPTSTQDASSPRSADANPPTFAAFSPNPLGHGALKQRSTILVHQKSPLLVATPPQITRALAYAYPFLSPLNRAAALLSWTAADPWESFLMVVAFWAITMYGDHVLRWAGPIVLLTGLIFGMYLRRYSSLSTKAQTGAKGQSGSTSADARHRKSLDEILDTLNIFTSRCNILLDPFLRLTDFLSTQRTATSATTRPALTALFIRILLITPLWIALTLPPFYIITTKRIVLSVGTIVLTWHSRPARISRVILWRSRLVRRICTALTGLQFGEPVPKPKPATQASGTKKPAKKTANDIAASLLLSRDRSAPTIRFTFTLFENQRRWLGIGWTSSMLAYERASWTDEHLNTSPNKDQFELPEVEGGHAKWRWVDAEWHVEMSSEVGSRRRNSGAKIDEEEEKEGWIYYDNKWRDPRRGRDSWGRYTRRRKWCRDAELIELSPPPTPAPTGPTHARSASAQPALASPRDSVASLPTPSGSTLVDSGAFSSTDAASATGASTGSLAASGNGSGEPGKRRGWLRRTSRAASERAASDKTGSTGSRRAGTGTSSAERRERDGDDDGAVEQRGDWGYGEDVRMGLG